MKRDRGTCAWQQHGLFVLEIPKCGHAVLDCLPDLDVGTYSCS